MFFFHEGPYHIMIKSIVILKSRPIPILVSKSSVDAQCLNRRSQRRRNQYFVNGMDNTIIYTKVGMSDLGVVGSSVLQVDVAIAPPPPPVAVPESGQTFA